MEIIRYAEFNDYMDFKNREIDFKTFMNKSHTDNYAFKNAVQIKITIEE